MLMMMRKTSGAASAALAGKASKRVAISSSKYFSKRGGVIVYGEKKKRKRAAADDSSISAPLVRAMKPIVGSRPHTLILGTMPSPESLAIKKPKNVERWVRMRGGDGPQNFGNPMNSFWNIVGSALGFRRDKTSWEEQTQIFTGAGFAQWDALESCKRKGALDADIKKGSRVPSDIPWFLAKFPTCERMVFHSTALVEALKVKAGDSHLAMRRWLDSGLDGIAFVVDANDPIKVLNPAKFDALHFKDVFVPPPGIRVVEISTCPSTSPASAALRPGAKEKTWHSKAFRLRRPPNGYVCPGCLEYGSNESESHYFVDCEHYSKWRKLAKGCKGEVKKRLEEKHGVKWYV